MSAPTQRKKVVVLCDGTWLSRSEALIKGARLAIGIEYYSNIALMAQALKPHDSNGVPQVSYYQNGVGTSIGVLANLVAGATGYGLIENLAEAYSFLVDNYSSGDEIFLHGFSRGAYTTRAVADFINYAGILKKSQMGFLIPILTAYSRRTPTSPARCRHAAEVLHKYTGHWPSYDATETEKEMVRKHSPYRLSGEDELKQHWVVPQDQPRAQPPPIKVVGVFDTVGALGIPGTFTLPVVRSRFNFFDDVLPGNVQYAFQALALNENRADFTPTLWKVRSDEKHAHHQVVKQTWFKGSHPDIGGGFYEHGLSDITLAWLVAQLQDHAEGPLLVFDTDLIKRTQDRTRLWAEQPPHPTRLPFMFRKERQVLATAPPEERSEKESVVTEGEETTTDGVTLGMLEPTPETLHYSVTLGPTIRPELSNEFDTLRARNPARLRKLWTQAENPETLLPTERELLWTETQAKLQPLSVAYGALYGIISPKLSTSFQAAIELMGALATIATIVLSYFTYVPARLLALLFTLSLSTENLMGVPPPNARQEVQRALWQAQMAWESIWSPDGRAVEVSAEPILLGQM
ncbi:hypothetical protein OC844_004174 [Tilletia horrida]|nr:hypothetical protein OC844_004174 [Tilletia horrida]